MKFYRLLFVMCLVVLGSAQAQTSANPWQISVGLTMPSINSDIVNNNGTVSSDDLSGSLGLPQASLYRKIYKGFSIGGQVALGKVTNDGNVGDDLDFFSMHGALKYGFNIDGKFSPYVKAGVYGSTSFDGTDSGSIKNRLF